jgi:hypothetical protein
MPQDRYYSTIDAFPGDGDAATTRLEGQALGTAVPWRAGDATLFLGAQLAFNPSQNVSALAEEYASAIFGMGDAVAVAEALLATEEAFLNRFLLPTKQSSYGACLLQAKDLCCKCDRDCVVHRMPMCLSLMMNFINDVMCIINVPRGEQVSGMDIDFRVRGNPASPG